MVNHRFSIVHQLVHFYYRCDGFYIRFFFNFTRQFGFCELDELLVSGDFGVQRVEWVLL